MAVLSNIQRTTELEAVNTVLNSAGEGMLPEDTILEDATAFDVKMVIGLLRTVTREVLTEPWKFNTEFGIIWRPLTEGFEYQDNNGDTVLINIFEDPGTQYAKWELSLCNENDGLELKLFPSQQFEIDDAAHPVLRDTKYHRDGPLQSKHPVIYLDVQFMLDFGYLPETARRYISVVASRRFCQQALGSAEKGSFSREDEVAALRLLKREHGLSRRYNFLNNPQTSRILGRDPGRMSIARRIHNKG